METSVRSDDKSDEVGLFDDALRAASGENFLGDPQTLQSLLRLAAGELSKGFADAKTGEERQFTLQKISRRTGLALLGKGSGVPLHKWNEAGMIDEFCAKWLALPETDPEERMEHAVLKFLIEIIALAEYAGEPGVLEEQWVPQMTEIFSRYTNLFLGVSPAQEAAINLSDTETTEAQDVEEWEKEEGPAEHPQPTTSPEP